MRLAFVAAIAGGIVVAAVLAMYASQVPTQDYSLSVDALKDEQSLFTNSRVVLSNTGKIALTNVMVSYGGNATEFIGTMEPGYKTTVYPPEGTPLTSVTVTADPDIRIVQAYRAPIKLPGMIGS
ncbi:hypothetical protein [Nitrososphaera viennensis]|uniref:Uncharacterized protein n=2 Tax=Nitrososphaera viennensis TaxID=1034015 RepID=A0A060HHN4_9ARCH|nr:hypothetical protein [Nitrososphaera viennensis]AIC14835.1 hypothetical protein NVIE_006300 [Nitrososphaera viennensis EN76]UVS69786.1 hypothetical protein NWT39_03120 [Nitrososphaera viennensis]